MDSLSLRHPFTALVAGPTNSGKTFFLKNVLKNCESVIHPAVDKIVWFYGVYQDIFNDIPNVTFVEGLPSNFKDHLGKNTIFIIDDLMVECGSDKRLTSLFTRGSHHYNLSIFFVVQNLFHKGKEFREITLNAHYLFLFKSRRDLNQINYLGRQLYPRNTKFFLEVYTDATKNAYSYLLIDLRPETEENMRLRTKILPGENMCIYQQK